MNAEPIEPENGRYRSDLLFVHGLWTTAEIFRPAALGFAHRGWRCEMLDLREGGGDALEGWCEALAAHVATLESPPVLVGHDAGGLVALAVAERTPVRAVVASAPLLGGMPSVHPALPVWWARLRGATLPPPLPDHPAWAIASQKGRARLAAALVHERARLVASVRGPLATPGRPRVPAVLVGYEGDALVSRHLVEITARGIEADFAGLPGGHYAMLEEPWDAWMSPVQRWLVRNAGEDLLELRGDEDLDPDALI